MSSSNGTQLLDPPTGGGRSTRHRQSRQGLPVRTGPILLVIVFLVLAVLGLSRVVVQGASDAQEQTGAEEAAPSTDADAGEATSVTETAAPAAQVQDNLLLNPEFENDLELQGWEPVAAVLQRVQPGRESAWSAWVQPDVDAPPSSDAVLRNLSGIQASGVLRSGTVGTTLNASAWIKPSRSGTRIQMVLVERDGEQAQTVDVVTVEPESTEWQEISLTHVVENDEATVDLVVGLADPEPEAVILVDGVVVTAKAAPSAE